MSKKSMSHTAFSIFGFNDEIRRRKTITKNDASFLTSNTNEGCIFLVAGTNYTFEKKKIRVYHRPTVYYRFLFNIFQLRITSFKLTFLFVKHEKEKLSKVFEISYLQLKTKKKNVEVLFLFFT